jgi:hypothetical protein
MLFSTKCTNVQFFFPNRLYFAVHVVYSNPIVEEYIVVHFVPLALAYSLSHLLTFVK